MRIVALLFSLWPCMVNATVWDKDLSPETFGSLEVFISDRATNGCWTNLGEAKTYAEDKLKLAGYTIEDGQGRLFTIDVVSERNGANCYGNIIIQMARGITTGGLFGPQEIARKSNIFSEHDNANTMVLDQIKLLIDEIK